MEMQQRNHLHKPDWSNLPTEILQLIAQFLLKPMNLKNFRLVCKNWHFSTLISAFLPRTIISDVPEKVISSSILLLRPHNSPHLNPLIVLAVEPIKGVIKLFNPFTRTLLVNLPENLDLACFRSTRLATAYHVVDDNHEPDMFSSCPYIKVLIYYTWSSRTIPSSRHCCMLTLSDGGKMLKSKPFTEHKVNGKRSPCENADDVVRYRGQTYAIDEQGSLWHSKYFYNFSFLVIDCTFCGKVRRRKRLAVLKSSSAERFLMIVPVNGRGRNLHFKVYMWTRDTYQCVWSEVTSFGKADQVLFVCRYYCFFAAAGEYPGCQLRNCIVFSDDAFPRYSESKFGWNYQGKVGNELAVYSLVGQDFYSMPAECYPGFPVILLQSPPPWILPNASSCLQPQFQSGLEEVKMIQQPDSNKEDSQVEESESESKDQTIDIISTNAAGVQTTSSPVVNDIEHVAEEVKETEKLGDTTIQAHHMEHLVQASVKKVVTVKFQGLDVESDYLPVLKKVWMKHGDIVEGSLIRSSDTKTMALTSLAKMVLILQTNSGKTLTNDQAHYLDSTLSDLQCMRLKVDWLAPFVENALSMHQSKPLQASLVKLQKAKSNAEEMEQKFLSEMAEMKRELDKDIKVVSESLPKNLVKCLGEGLC